MRFLWLIVMMQYGRGNKSSINSESGMGQKVIALSLATLYFMDIESVMVCFKSYYLILHGYVSSSFLPENFSYVYSLFISSLVI